MLNIIPNDFLPSFIAPPSSQSIPGGNGKALRNSLNFSPREIAGISESPLIPMNLFALYLCIKNGEKSKSSEESSETLTPLGCISKPFWNIPRNPEIPKSDCTGTLISPIPSMSMCFGFAWFPVPWFSPWFSTCVFPTSSFSPR